MADTASISFAARVRTVADATAGLGPGFAVVVASLYGIGFLIVNAYLGGYGVRDMEPLRTRYIATGISFSALAMVTAAFGVGVHDLLVRRLAIRSVPGQLLGLVGSAFAGAIVGSLLLVTILASLRASPFGPFSGSGVASRIADVELFSFGAVIAVVVVRMRRRDWHTAIGALQTLTTVGTFTSALIGYANTIYPALPPWFGGGKPDVVQLVLDDAATVCPDCGTGPLRLLDEDGARVIVLIEAADGTQRAVEIGRPAVHSITHNIVTPRP